MLCELSLESLRLVVPFIAGYTNTPEAQRSLISALLTLDLEIYFLAVQWLGETDISGMNPIARTKMQLVAIRSGYVDVIDHRLSEIKPSLIPWRLTQRPQSARIGVSGYTSEDRDWLTVTRTLSEVETPPVVVEGQELERSTLLDGSTSVWQGLKVTGRSFADLYRSSLHDVWRKVKSLFDVEKICVQRVPLTRWTAMEVVGCFVTYMQPNYLPQGWEGWGVAQAHEWLDNDISRYGFRPHMDLSYQTRIGCPKVLAAVVLRALSYLLEKGERDTPINQIQRDIRITNGHLSDSLSAISNHDLTVHLDNVFQQAQCVLKELASHFFRDLESELLSVDVPFAPRFAVPESWRSSGYFYWWEPVGSWDAGKVEFVQLTLSDPMSQYHYILDRIQQACLIHGRSYRFTRWHQGFTGLAPKRAPVHDIVCQYMHRVLDDFSSSR